MAYAETNAIKGCGSTDVKRSRIEQDIERVKKLANDIEMIADRVGYHAHSLGYFAPPAPVASTGNIAQVGINMSDMLDSLDRSVVRCRENLSLFD